MPTLFTSYYEKQYKAPCCSFSSFCTYLIYTIAVLVPFLFAFSAGGLYKKEERYWEQPTVQFRNVLVL